MKNSTRLLYTGAFAALLVLFSFGSAHDTHDKPGGGHALAHMLGDISSFATNPAVTFGVVSEGPADGGVLEPIGRGERRLSGATTDVWVHDGYAYLGTFNTPCGTGKRDEAGVRVFDVRNPREVRPAGSLPSVAGSRVNDVKVMSGVNGDVLVHSNERCGRGTGGFEVYNVDDPEKPVHLAHVQTDSVNPSLRDSGEADEGVHNLFLFSRDGHDYAAAQVSTPIGNFQIFDITDPQNVARVGWFGPERMEWPEVDWETETDPDLLEAATDYMYSGYGALANRILHDHTVTPDGRTAYLAHWDAGLITLDISDLANPRVVSVALEPTSEDGEVSSHSVWPTADGRVVVEGEEDFSPYGTVFRITEGPDAGVYGALEGAFTAPLSGQPGGRLEGRAVYVGDACGALPRAPARSLEETRVALAARGGCPFVQKGKNVVAAGYAGMIVFNDAAEGDALTPMGGASGLRIPGLLVGYRTGLAIAGVEDEGALRPGALGHTIGAGVEADGWSGLRIWDFSDPANPVLASTFNTVCSAHPNDPSCDPRGIYSSHNVMVDGDKVYVSWYAEGVLVVDISDPYNPVEVARYHGAGEDFEASNGGIQEIWGVYKEPGNPYVYASDRNGGLYVLEEGSVTGR